MSTNRILAAAISAACGLHAATAAAQPAAGTRNMEELLVYGAAGGAAPETGSRLGLTLLETPATVDLIDGDAIRARLDTSVLDAVTRSASFTNESNPGNGHSSIAARGFRGQGTVTKLYDGTNYYTAAGTITFPFDTWGVERIEVLKGPSSVLYGEGGIGGAINVVPRRPDYERSGDLRLVVGENNTTFLGLDYTGPISDSVAYRVDLSKSRSDNWVNDGDSDAEMVSFALRWDVSEDLALSARYDWGDQSPMKYFGIPVVDGDFVRAFVGQNFNVADAEVRYEDASLRLKADWRISDMTSLQAEVFNLSTDRYWANTEYYSYDSGTGLVDRWDPLVIGHDMDHSGLRTNLRFAPADGRINASLGFEINDISFTRPTNFGPANPDPIDWGNDFDTVDPRSFRRGVLADLTDAPVLLDNQSDVSQYAVFGEAQLHITNQLALVGALRFDDFQTDYVRLGQPPIDQNADALTGRLGLVYDWSDRSALYAQYGTGATHPSNSVVTASAANREAELIESEQIELGIKRRVAGSGLQWNLALFDIKRNNLIEDDPDSGDPSDLIVIPKQTSQGIEFGFSYAASDSFVLYGNIATLDAETDTGETPTYVPEDTYNLGFAWNAGPVRFIADARYVGERYHPSVPIPSYTVVDASVRWAASDALAFTIKGDNLFDELYASTSYYSDTWLVGKPRTLSVAVDYDF